MELLAIILTLFPLPFVRSLQTAAPMNVHVNGFGSTCNASHLFYPTTPITTLTVAFDDLFKTAGNGTKACALVLHVTSPGVDPNRLPFTLALSELDYGGIVQLDDGGSAKISTTVSMKGGTSVQTEKSLVGPLGPQDWVIKDRFAIAPISPCNVTANIEIDLSVTLVAPRSRGWVGMRSIHLMGDQWFKATPCVIGRKTR